MKEQDRAPPARGHAGSADLGFAKGGRGAHSSTLCHPRNGSAATTGA
jgi:hypothetical protein